MTDDKDTRTYIRVHDGMPDHPKIVGLSAASKWGLMELWMRSRNGFVDIETVPAKLRNELWANNLMLASGKLWGYGEVFYGPFLSNRGRPRIPAALRQAVYERDNFACITCGSTKNLSLDHRMPYSLGGEDVYENLDTMCLPCNMSKGARFDGPR